MPKYWIGVASGEHVLRAVQQGFCQLSHGNEAPVKRLQQGDWILYYSPREKMRGGESLQQFTAIGKIMDEAPYQVEQEHGFHPFRRRVKYLKAIAVGIHPMLSKLSFVKSPHWGQSFRRGFFSVSLEDCLLIAQAMRVSTKELELLKK